MKTLLWFAGACPEPGSDAAWAFVCRDQERGAARRFLHSAAGMAARGAPAAADQGAVYGLGYGLRWLADRGMAGAGKLELYGPLDVVLLAAGPPPAGVPPAALDRVRALLAPWPEWRAEAVAAADNGADWLAREHWESATGKEYPARPARRRRLPGLSR